MTQKTMLKEADIKKFISYLIVGGIATVVEWTGFYIFWNLLGIYYLAATVMAVIISIFANWLLGHFWTFRDSRGKKNIFAEIAGVYAASALGVALNMVIMWGLVEWVSMYEMFAKAIATAIVFIYNYSIRRFVIYREDR